MSFFLDTNIPYSALTVFKQANLKAVHARDVGLSQASDEKILDYAAKNGLILITKDLDFANKIKFPTAPRTGLVILRLPPFFHATEFAEVLRDFLNSVSEKELTNSVTIVKLGRYRIRKLE